MPTKLERIANIATIVGALALCFLVGQTWIRGKGNPIGPDAAGIVGTQNAPADSTMELDGIPIKGKANAKVVMIEFADYECPYCAQHSNGVSKEIDKEFVETGKIRYAFANNPIPSHRNAIPLAQAAICGGQQDRYWQMHDRLYEAEPKTREELISIVDELGLDHLKFEQCLDQAPDAFKEIGRDTIAAKSLGFSATPAFAIGLADSQGRVQIQKLITGAQSFAVFKSAIGEIVQK